MSTTSPSPAAIPILLIDPLHARRAALRAILAPPWWDTHEARTCQEAIGILDDLPVGVAICDTEVPDGDWQDLLRNFQCRQHPPNLVVSARVADERLWAEVLNLGGYDVLAQPFDRSEVLRVARMAGQAWHRSLAGNLAGHAAAS
jgi:DNA-binding response OmpR family regulator